MKNLIFVLMILFSFHVKGQEKNDFICGTIITTFNKEIIEYRFKSFADLQEGIDEIIKEFEFKNFENEKAEECKFTIEIKVEMLLGISTTSISESISTICTDKGLEMVTKRFKTMLLAMISMG